MDPAQHHQACAQLDSRPVAHLRPALPGVRLPGWRGCCSGGNMIRPKKQHLNINQVHIVANIIRAATYLIALLVMLNCKRKGEVTSGTLFIYWLVATACGAVTFRWKSYLLLTAAWQLLFFWRSLVADPQFFVDLDNLSSLLLLVQVYNHNHNHPVHNQWHILTT